MSLGASGDLSIGGTGAAVDRLEWDVKLYLTLNGALHDAAVAAWGTKRHYDYTRPISMIRYLGGRGELPHVDGLIETITADSARPGERHAHLADLRRRGCRLRLARVAGSTPGPRRRGWAGSGPSNGCPTSSPRS